MKGTGGASRSCGVLLLASGTPLRGHVGIDATDGRESRASGARLPPRPAVPFGIDRIPQHLLRRNSELGREGLDVSNELFHGRK